MKTKKRIKRVVVSRDAGKTRQPKSTSFDLTDAYEVDLLNYAEDPMHGNFSEFVKRLIAWHRDGQRNLPHQTLPTEPVENNEEDKKAMGGFL